jgi:hypothetical protein
VAEAERVERIYDAGVAQFGTPHPEIRDWKRNFHMEFTEQLPFRFGLAAGDYDLFELTMFSVDKTTLSAGSLVGLASVREKNAKRMDALFTYRDALAAATGEADEARRAATASPRDIGARDALRKAEDDLAQAKDGVRRLESQFLQSEMDKAKGTIEIARENFHKYMKERGFDENRFEPRGQRSDLALDDKVWQAWSSGPLAWYMAWAGRPNAEAAIRDRKVQEMNDLFTGLGVMQGLRERGHTFAEMRAMDGNRLRAVLPSNPETGERCTRDQADRVLALVREAMDFEDVKALVNDDRAEFRDLADKMYWNRQDIADTWREWVFDSLSPRNLLFIFTGPISRGATSAAARAGYWFAGNGEKIVVASEAVIGAQRVQRLLMAGRAVQALGAGRVIAPFFGMLDKLIKIENSMSWLRKANWTTGKMLGFIAIYEYGGQRADYLGGKKSRALFEAVLPFASDAELLHKILQDARIPCKGVAALIEKEGVSTAKAAIKEAQDLRAGTDSLGKVIDRHAAGPVHPENPGAAELSTTPFHSDPKAGPVGEPIHDLRALLEKARQAAAANQWAEAKKAVRAAQSLMADLDQYANELKVLADGMESVARDLRKLGPWEREVADSLADFHRRLQDPANKSFREKVLRLLGKTENDFPIDASLDQFLALFEKQPPKKQGEVWELYVILREAGIDLNAVAAQRLGGIRLRGGKMPIADMVKDGRYLSVFFSDDEKAEWAKFLLMLQVGDKAVGKAEFEKALTVLTQFEGLSTQMTRDDAVAKMELLLPSRLQADRLQRRLAAVVATDGANFVTPEEAKMLQRLASREDRMKGLLKSGETLADLSEKERPIRLLQDMVRAPK